MRATLAFLVLAAVAIAMPSGAGATSGFGCYRVNVGADDPLAVRAGPRANAAIVARVSAADQPIIALDGLARGEAILPSLLNVHRTELADCRPDSRPLGARWCPVTLFGGGGAAHGWIKRRFVDHSECP